ncbi:MFS transporter [Aliiglaciecola sp. 3_MG-2023]|uniref:MFS transporter n=1 Tax=Aliiglaciecola sp. 3_MG-2023 TaxID=3062644 RepID=UPI0026E1ED66|nr:MFS transporter [Aliiglaciecola sp. 3_MG-2023]MDO6693105.1 MFS transporter [Aliiglaciecola sp. 3_MG-2023]
MPSESTIDTLPDPSLVDSVPDKIKFATFYSLGGRVTIMALILTAALCTMDRMVLSMVVEPLRADLSLTETQIGVLQGFSFSLLYAFAGIPLGLMADRLNRNKLLAMAVLTWSGGTIACGMANSFETLFIFRMLVGAGEAALWPVAISLIGDIAPQRNRGFLIGGIILGQLFGASLSLIIGGQLLQAAMGGGLAHLPVIGDMEAWRMLFIVYGIAGSLAIVMLLMGKEPPRERTGGSQSSHPLAGLGEFYEFFKVNWKSVGSLYLLTMVVAIVQYSGLAWNVPLFLRRFELGPQQVGLIMGVVMFAAGGIGSLAGGFASKLTGKSPVKRLNVMICAYCLCVGYGLIAFNPSLNVSIFLVSFPGVLLAMAGVMSLVIMQDIVPSHMRGVATSVNTLFASLIGASMGPMLVAMLTQYVFEQDNMVGVSLGLVVGPAMVIAVILAFVLKRQVVKKYAGMEAEKA